MNWLDKIPFLPLLIIAILLGMAPYPSQPQPHLVEKLVMLSQGSLSKPIDIFDLFLHGTPAILLLLKGIRTFGKSRAN
jgi:hypothetical protein